MGGKRKALDEKVGTGGGRIKKARCMTLAPDTIARLHALVEKGYGKSMSAVVDSAVERFYEAKRNEVHTSPVPG